MYVRIQITFRENQERAEIEETKITCGLSQREGGHEAKKMDGKEQRRRTPTGDDA